MCKLRLLVLIVFCLILTLPPTIALADPPAGWWDSDWTYRKTLTLDNSASSENLINFPVLVHLDNTNIDWTKVQNSGQDIRFVDSDDSTLLDYEIEEWDDTVSADIWVEAPQIDAGSTEDFIYMYYGNDGATDGQDVEGTWNSDYVMVQHMDDDPDNSHIRDSTGYSNDGTKTGANEPNEVDSGIAKGQDGDGIDDKVVVSHSDSLDLQGNLTIKLQVTVDAEEAGGVVDKGYVSGGYMVWYQSEVSGFTLYVISAQANTGAVSLDTLYYVAGVVNGVANQIYLDGVPKNSLDSLVPGGNLVDVFIGSDAYARLPQCTISEVRISSTDLSGEWIEAQHLSMTDAYITYGSEEAVPANPPTGLTLTQAADYQVDASWTLGEGNTNVMLRRQIGDYPSNRTDGVLVYEGSGTSVSDIGASIGLELDKYTYYYRIWGQNALSVWSETYDEGTIGGENLILIAFAVIIVALMALGFVFKKGIIFLVAGFAATGLGFILFGEEALSLQWVFGWVAIMTALVCFIQALLTWMALRPGPEIDEQEAYRKQVLTITRRKRNYPY